MTLKRLFFYLLIVSLMLSAGACSPAATPVPPTLAPTPTTQPTLAPTPLPTAMQALLEERDMTAHEFFSTLEKAQANNFPQEQIDAIIRSYVPTIEAMQQELATNGVQVPPIALPPVPEIAARAEVFDIGMVTKDGVRIMGTYYRPEATQAPGVVLLHMLGHQREDWADFAAALQTAGFGVLAIDLRGHGQSEGTRQWLKMSQDAAIALDFLRSRPELDPDRILLAGASIGANIALNAAAADERVVGVALLSPGLDYHGVKTEPALQRYGQRPLFLAASSEDSYAANSVQQLDAQAAGPHQLLMLEKQGHGTDMLNAENNLSDTLLQWFAQFKVPSKQ